MRFSEYSHSAASLAAASLVCGCATHELSKAPPAETRPIVIKYAGDDVSGMTDLPLGTYRIPDSQVIVSGHQKAGRAGMAFGLIGVAVANSIDKSGGKSAVGSSEAALHVTLKDEGKDKLAQLVGTKYPQKFTLDAGVDGPTVTVTGDIILTFVSDSEALPFVDLRVRFAEPKPSTKTWTTRYLCSIGPPKPLQGPGGWVDDQGAGFRTTVSAELERVLDVMLSDMSSPTPRDESHRVLVTGYFPFLKGRFQIIGYPIADSTDYFIFTPKIGDAAVLAGVQVLDKSVDTFRDATSDDKTKKIE
jgi:hypothetical protein